MLAPFLETDHANIEYYHNFTQSIAECTEVFSELNIDRQWQNVTVADYKEIIAKIASAKVEGEFPIVLNLCDRDDSEWYAGSFRD